MGKREERYEMEREVEKREGGREKRGRESEQESDPLCHDTNFLS